MKLTDTQTAVLTSAVARPDGAILPLPAHIRGGATGKVCDALVAKGLAINVGLPGEQTLVIGVKLGRHGAENLSVQNKAAALERAKGLAPLLADMKVRGLSSRAIAAELTTLGVATPSGGRWHPQTVMRALGRAEGTTA